MTGATTTEHPPTLLDLDPEALAAHVESLGQKPFRARQILKQVYTRLADSYSAMTDVPAKLGERLAATLPIDPLTLDAVSDDHHGTTKAAYRLRDGHVIEAVLIREGERRTVCVSTQAGCALGCRFCASGLRGLARNLTVGEIVAQVWHAARELNHHALEAGQPPAERLTNIVVMGVGEPLANVRALLPALDACCERWGFGLSARRVTVSTVGILPGIDALAASGHPVNLAISLHAPDDETRSRLIPLNDSIGGIPALLAAGRRYFQSTGREVTYEYVLIPGVNGAPEQATKLARLLREHGAMPCNVNVIPYNAVAELEWREPTDPEVSTFVYALEDEHINVHVRKRKGPAIHAACGQLRLERDATRP